MTATPTRPIRVLRIIARMNVGGPAWQVSALIRGLSGDRFESLLISGEVEDGEADFLVLRDPELPVMKINQLGRSVRFGDDLRAFIAIRRIIKDFQPDIVHTHTAKSGLLGRLAAVSCRVPVRVHTFHGHLLQGYFGRVASYMLVLVERVLARGTTALVAVGYQVRDDLIGARIGRSGQYTVIPPGVGPSKVLDKTEARAVLGLPIDAPVVVFVGRLTAIKRPDRLIGALELVLNSRPDAVLAIAGEGDLLDATQRLAEPLGSSVRFLGWQADLSQVYAAADCAVLTSDSEGMPVTLIEAAMAGVPSVTTDVGSAREVVLNEVTGLVVPPEPAAIADGLVRLFDDDFRKRLGESAKNRAEREFGTNRLVGDHLNLYGRLVANIPTSHLQTRNH